MREKSLTVITRRTQAFTMLLLSIAAILTAGQVSAQVFAIDSCGLDDTVVLNQHEVQYFNETMLKQRSKYKFDFSGKKVAFASGNFGKGVLSKKEYFNQWGRDYYNSGLGVVNILMILTEEERIKSGGYDAIVVSWSKTGVVGNHRKRLIERLNAD